MIYNMAMSSEDFKLISRAKRLVARLERLSSDSSYAHQASGLRGAILRGLDARKQEGSLADPAWMMMLVERGEMILIEAARQIPDPD